MFKRGLLLVIILFLIPSIYATENNLIGYWNLEDIKDGITEDSSNNLYHGVISGNPIVVEGKVGKALQFGGLDAVLLDLPKIDKTTGKKVTVEFWMYWNGESNTMPFGFESCDLYFNPTSPIQFGFNTGYGDLWGIGDAGSLSNKWTYVVAEFNIGDVKLNKLYIDGAEQQVVQQWPPSPELNRNCQPSRYASINGWRVSASYRFKGKLDEVKIWNGAFTANEIKTKYDKIITPQSQEPIAYWNFDEGSGTIAGDSSGNKNNGNIVNNPTWVKGIKGNALSFDGNDDYVDVGNPNTLQLTKDLSIGAWIKTNSLSGNIYIITKASSSFAQPYYQYSLQMDNNCADKFEFDLGIGGTLKTLCTSKAVEMGKWFYVVGTYDGTTRRLYINGVEDTSTAVVNGNLDTFNTKVLIGKYEHSTSNLFKGEIDEVSVYNRVLTADEIKTKYDSSKPSTIVTIPGTNEQLDLAVCEPKFFWFYNNQKTGDIPNGAGIKIYAEAGSNAKAYAVCLRDINGNILSDGTNVNFKVFEEDGISEGLIDTKVGTQSSLVTNSIAILDVAVNVIDNELDDENEFYFDAEGYGNSGKGENNLIYINEPVAEGCVSNADCPAGDICEAGSCVAGPAVQCQTNADCLQGETCVGGFCAASVGCQSDTDCNQGEVCLYGACNIVSNDNDMDGMPNDYEISNGLNPDDANDAYTDLDGDGITNLVEYLGNTDPNVDDNVAVTASEKTGSEVGSISALQGKIELNFPVPKKYTLTTTADNVDLSNLKSVDIYPAYEVEGQKIFCEDPVNIEIET